MKNIIPILALTAATLSIANAQTPVATTIELESEPRTATPGQALKRSGYTVRAPGARTFAFAGSHPFQERAAQPLIIQTSEGDPSITSQIREDMAVMGRLLERASSGFTGEPDKVLGVDILVFGGRGARNIYLEDYGVIFTLNANIPLRAPAEKTKSGPEQKQEDAEWESARRELFGNNGNNNKAPATTQVYWNGPRREYKARDVERLKEGILDALRNATKIRHLKDDEAVTVVVRSRDATPGDELVIEDNNDQDDTTLVISIRKKDIDAIAKKGISRDEFRKLAKINTY